MPPKEFLSLSKRHKRRLRSTELADRIRLSQNSEIYVDPTPLTINTENELNYACELVVNDNENEVEKDVELRINLCTETKANNDQ